MRPLDRRRAGRVRKAPAVLLDAAVALVAHLVVLSADAPAEEVPRGAVVVLGAAARPRAARVERVVGPRPGAGLLHDCAEHPRITRVC